MIPVIWWTIHEGIDARGPWDTGMLEEMFAGALWSTDLKFEHEETGVLTGLHSHAVFVVPARHHASPEDVAQLNVVLSRFEGVVLILVGDEEGVFPWREVKHENIRMWVMMPRPELHGDIKGWAYFFGNGPRPGTSTLLFRPSAPEKRIPWVFAGQVTHPRRKQAVDALLRVRGRGARGVLHETRGFGRGLAQQEYLELMSQAKVAPCPSGPATPDTFRLYEALEAGCLPLADMRSPQMNPGYWEFVYDTFPIPQVDDWSGVAGHLDAAVSQWPVPGNEASAWWSQQKRGMVKRLERDIAEITGEPLVRRRPDATAIVTTSPIPSHPSLDVLEETLESIWSNLGGIDVVIACDGVRPEQSHLAPAYDEYVRQVCWKAQHWWSNVVPVVSSRHLHQAGMTKLALDHVDTSTILFVEHDTPLVTDEQVPWDLAIEVVRWGAIDVLRFHHEAHVHPEHEHLMLDMWASGIIGLPVRRTIQWSQRPHLARTGYYREMLHEHFPDTARTMIEDKMHGVAQSDPSKHRIAIFHPPGGNIKRSYHLDGRQNEPKFDMRFR